MKKGRTIRFDLLIPTIVTLSWKGCCDVNECWLKYEEVMSMTRNSVWFTKLPMSVGYINITT